MHDQENTTCTLNDFQKYLLPCPSQKNWLILDKYKINISASYQSPKYSFRCCNNGCCPTIHKFTSSFLNSLTKQRICSHDHSNYFNTLECCTLMPVHQSYLSHCTLPPNEKTVTEHISYCAFQKPAKFKSCHHNNCVICCSQSDIIMITRKEPIETHETD